MGPVSPRDPDETRRGGSILRDYPLFYQIGGPSHLLSRGPDRLSDVEDDPLLSGPTKAHMFRCHEDIFADPVQYALNEVPESGNVYESQSRESGRSEVRVR